MINRSLERFELLCDTIPGILECIDLQTYEYKPTLLKWSKKQILGHLIDSAVINYQRFIRGQFENSPLIFYDQNLWHRYNYYQEIDTRQLIDFWKSYNRQICEIMKQIPHENLYLTCKSEDGSELTIEYLFIDYVVHLEYHLKQIIEPIGRVFL
jgi:hypothetical protein